MSRWVTARWTTTTAAAAQTATPVIHISGATYRADGGGSCKTDKQVRRFCEGRNSCDFKVKNTNLCGDPAPGKVKLLEVTYKCQVNGRNLFGSKTVTKSEGKHLRMSCPSS